MRFLISILLVATATAQMRFAETYFFASAPPLEPRYGPPPLDRLQTAAGSDGSVVFLGLARASDLPVVNAFQSEWANQRCLDCADLYVARSRPDGLGLAYATYLGEDGLGEYAEALAVASDGSTYLLTNGALGLPVGLDLADGREKPRSKAGYVVAVGPDGAPLRVVRLPVDPDWRFLVVDATGAAYVGGTLPIGGPEFGARRDNIAVLKLAPGLEELVYSAAHGGSRPEWPQSMAVDTAGRVHLAGVTWSADLPGVDGGLQSALVGERNLFVLRLSADGLGVEQATYFGGERGLTAGIAIGPDGAVLLNGDTGSEGFPLVKPARPHPAAGLGYLAKLTADLSSIVYSTFLGASAIGPSPAAVDQHGRTYALRSIAAFDPPAEGGGPRFGGAELAAVDQFSTSGEILRTWYFDDADGMTLDAAGELAVVGNGVGGLVPGRVVRRTQDLGEESIRPQRQAPFLARTGPLQPDAPYIDQVVNGASFLSGRTAPGELLTLFGSGLGPESGEAFELTDGQLPLRIAGVEANVGGLAAPLLFAGSGQINLAAPFDLEPRSLAAIRVNSGRGSSNRIWQTVAAADPGVFTQRGRLPDDGAILNQDGTLNAPTNPAEPGSILQVFGAGGGRLEPPLAAGRIAGAELSRVVGPVRVAFGGHIELDAVYAGSAPGLIAGVLQVNVPAPDLGPGLSIVDVKIRIGDAESGPLRAYVSIAR